MSTVMKTGLKPDHRERATASRTRGMNFKTTAAETAVGTAAEMKGVGTIPVHPAVTNLSQPKYSPALGRSLNELMTREQTKRDIAREEELARLRAVQKYD